MTIKNRIFFTCLAACFFLAGINLNTAFAQGDTEPVRKLRHLYKMDKDFRTTMDLAFKNLTPLTKEGTPNPWIGKNFDDLCTFFNKWYYFIPTPGTGLMYIKEFSWFYNGNKYGLKIVSEEPGLSWTKEFAMSRKEFMETPGKEMKKVIKEWEETPGIHIDEFIIPPGGFKHFNDFFTRSVKPGVRPIAAPTDDSVVVAPADCVIKMIDSSLTAETRLNIKGREELNIKSLLNNSKFADKFIGGTAVSCMLLPPFYHHFHAPVSGSVVQSEEDVKGVYFGMKEFHRGYFVIKTEKYGFVAMITVGLTTISSVNFQEKYRNVKPGGRPVPVYKGDSLGYFQYGGSLVILLFEPGCFGALKVLQGQRIGIIEGPAKK
jgi:phosphatidylserine decarboxylase